MLAISLIVFFSVVLFAYWFRYSCLLILQSRASESTPLAADSSLAFSKAEPLQSGANPVEYLDRVHRDLTDDYRKLCFLLRCSAESGVNPVERRMLMLDYWLMQGWYAVSLRIAPPQARKALEEIATIVVYFSSSMGRQTVRRSAQQT